REAARPPAARPAPHWPTSAAPRGFPVPGSLARASPSLLAIPHRRGDAGSGSRGLYRFFFTTIFFFAPAATVGGAGGGPGGPLATSAGREETKAGTGARAGGRGGSAGGRAGARAARTAGRTCERGRSGNGRPGASSPMSTRPRKLAPSTMMTRGERMSPTMRPSRVSSTLSVAAMLPTTTPLTTAFLTETLAFTTPEGSTINVRVSDSSPSTRPRTVRSSSPLSLPLMRMDGPMTVFPAGPESSFGLAMGLALHVHVDVALEGGTVGNED